MANMQPLKVDKKKKPAGPAKKPLADFSSKRKASDKALAGRKMSKTPSLPAPKATATPLADLLKQDERRRKAFRGNK